MQEVSGYFEAQCKNEECIIGGNIYISGANETELGAAKTWNTRVSRWIKLDPQFPEEKNEVWLVWANGNTCIGWYEPDAIYQQRQADWWADSMDDMPIRLVGTPTHYQLLPEPPNGDEK
jgi:hypothetical protein